MQPIPLVRVWSLQPFMRFLEGIGAPVDRWLEESGIPLDLLETPSHPIPLTFALQFADRAAREEGAETLGIDVGRQMAAEDFGGWSVLAGCVTLYDRIRTCCGALAQENTALRMWVEVEGDSAKLCHRAVDGLGPGLRHCEDFDLMLILEGVGRAADLGWRPEAIRLPSPRSERFSRDELFRDVRMEYGSAQLEVVFPSDLLSRPLRLRHSSTARTTREHELRDHVPAQDFVGSVEETVAVLLHRGSPSVDEVAQLTNSSVRTLQRRLGEEGLSLSTIVDRARFRLADEYLHDPTASVTDVAYQLGYSNPPAFTRAFRRWTGISPHAYQKQLHNV